MRSRLLAPSRARLRVPAVTAAACTALAAAVGGCAAATNTAVTVTGSNLTIYVSAPTQAANDPQTQDVLDAEQLAFQQAGGKIGNFKLKLVKLAAGKLSNSARTAIEDLSAVAYVGEIRPGASRDSIGITNAQDLLQVSPTDTALELTVTTPAVPGAPTDYYEALKTYSRTFARVVPNTRLEAKAQVGEMESLSVKKLYIADDGSKYGAAIALAVKQDVPSSIGVVQGQASAAKFAASGADALFLGAGDESIAAHLFNDVSASSPSAKLFGPSALDDAAFLAALGSTKPNVYISAPGFRSKDLTAAGQKFVADFKAAYNRTPALKAIFGYEAMAAVLDVLREAGASANNRSTVVHDFFAIKNRASALGTYSINADGDTSLAPFVFNRLESGRLVPFKFVQAQG